MKPLVAVCLSVIILLPALSFTHAMGNSPPTAIIDSISPNPANEGQSVSFTGHGFDADGTISEYNWTSTIDGKLSSSATFSTSTLSAGTHTIHFAVKDNNGTWSQPAIATLNITGAGPKKLVILAEPNAVSDTDFTVSVKDSKGIIVTGAKVTFRNSTKIVSTISTGLDGKAIFHAPQVYADSTYALFATKSGYQDADEKEVIVKTKGVAKGPVLNDESDFWTGMLVVTLMVVVLAAVIAKRTLHVRRKRAERTLRSRPPGPQMMPYAPAPGHIQYQQQPQHHQTRYRR